MTAALEGGEWSAARPGRTLLHGKDPVPILQEAGWVAPGPVWKGGKSRPHLDSIPDRPARSQSLYRLSYPAKYINKYDLKLSLINSNPEKLPMTIIRRNMKSQFTSCILLDIAPVSILAVKLDCKCIHLYVIHFLMDDSWNNSKIRSLFKVGPKVKRNAFISISHAINYTNTLHTSFSPLICRFL